MAASKQLYVERSMSNIQSLISNLPMNWKLALGKTNCVFGRRKLTLAKSPRIEQVHRGEPPPAQFHRQHAITCFYLLLFIAALIASSNAAIGAGFLQITNGYFWDPATSDYFIARGVAYQIWNPPVGANQSLDQLDYDLLEFKKMRANSVRVEMTWSQVQVAPDRYDWTKPDHLIQKAEELGLKLFVIIGYQYPPTNWFPMEWHGINNRGERSDVINYEDPQARTAYQSYIGTVTARYKNSSAIGGWILGNEYAYFDLWEDPIKYPVHRFLGYDAISQQNFRNFLQAMYRTNIAALNANWQSAYTNFNAVVMPLEYPDNRNLPGFHDLIQWRKQSIADFVAIGAVAARQADTNHLRTYSMVGGIFNGRDANYSCEDARTIVDRCAVKGAPLNFWSLNNYAWTAQGSEMRSAAFGIGKYQAQSGLPVMISETGHSDTEDLFDYDKTTKYSYSGARQPKTLPGTLWESLLSGAIGIHFFSWNDRSLFTQGYFLRERGFGIVQENRQPKEPVYTNMVAMFRQMQNIHVDQLLGGSRNPPADVQYFWSTNADMVWPRANQENAMIWGALKRLGFQPGIIDDAAFEQGAYTNAPVLLLSRCYQMNSNHLQQLTTHVIPAGIHVHAQVDLPGQFDAYHRPNSDWASTMRTYFGIEVSGASTAFDLGVTNDCYSPIRSLATAALGSLTNGYTVDFSTWKLWRNISPASAKVVLSAFGYTNTGFPNNADCPYLDATHYPALLVNATGGTRGKTAVNSFALGDTYQATGTAEQQWNNRSTILRSIYRDHFGIKPAIDLSGTGSERVSSTYRRCRNGSILIALLNEDTNTASLTISAPMLLAGRKVEDLSFGGVLVQNSNGALTYALHGDDYLMMYAYPSNSQIDDSLINTNANKIWFMDAPLTVWPNTVSSAVQIGYDTADTNLTLTVTLEQISPRSRIYSQSTAASVSGKGSLPLQISIPDADVNNPEYISSHQNAEYSFHATLRKAGVVVSDVSLPVRLLFGVHPLQSFPNVVTPGQTYSIPLGWEELPTSVGMSSTLPSYPTPLDRAAIWDSLIAGQEHYSVVLELKSGNQTITSDKFLTIQGTDRHVFSIKVPSGTSGPFTWAAHVDTATNVFSRNVLESFEGYVRGAQYDTMSNTFTNYNFVAPWEGYVYSADKTDLRQNLGVQLEGSDGSQSGFIVATNMAREAYSGFGMFYVFPNGDWSLPVDRSQWTNYVFSCDFRESHGYRCAVELQLQDSNTNWIQYSQLYDSGTNAWMSVKASLAQFQTTPNSPASFDPSRLHAIVVNIPMLTPDVQYVGSFDNIRFTGPETNQGGGEITSIYSSANDSLGWLSAQRGPSGVTISWIGSGSLQSSGDVTGTWSTVTNASNPFVIAPSAKQRFFRLQK